MRIVYLGNYRHPHCTEVHLARELERLGHDVVRVQEPPGGVSSLQWSGFKAELQHRVYAASDKMADLFLWTRTWGLPPEATAFWAELESAGVVTASYHLDLYLGLERESRMASDPFWTTQHVFTPDGDPGSAERFQALGINHHFSPPAVVSDECQPGTFRPEFAHDVVFVGSAGTRYHPEYPFRRELLAWLYQEFGDRFRHYGLGGGIEHIRDGDLNDLYASSKVVIGDSLSLPGRTRYVSDRPFETLGRGGFLLMPWTTSTEFMEKELGFTDSHLRWYYPNDPSHLRTVINHYLEAPVERALIAETGQRFVRTNHTYKHRLKAAIEVMFG